MHLIKKNALFFLPAVIAVIAVCLGIRSGNHNTILMGIISLWAGNLWYCIRNFKKRLMYFFFLCVYFVFLMGRPVVSMMEYKRWTYFEPANLNFGLTALIVSLISIQIGAMLADYYSERRKKKHPEKEIKIIKPIEKYDFTYFLKGLSVALLLLSFTAFMMLEVEELLFIKSASYVKIYSAFKSAIPYPVHVIGSFFKYAVCIFLATMPKKKEATVVLGMYFISAVPTLIGGARGQITINALFILAYFGLRDAMGDKEKWMALPEKLIVGIGTPFAILGLGAINYIRKNSEIKMNIFMLMLDFFQKQGVSFDVLCIGYSVMNRLPKTGGFRSYMLGPFIDYIGHGNIAQAFFGATSLGTGNNLREAFLSNSFAHNMSYLAKGYKYLMGEGYGSSYIIESFVDLGWAGVIAFSIALGFLLCLVPIMMKKNGFTRYFLLICITSIFWIPRGEALGFLSFIIEAQFIVPTVACFAGAGLLYKLFSKKRKVITLQNSQ